MGLGHPLGLFDNEELADSAGCNRAKTKGANQKRRTKLRGKRTETVIRASTYLPILRDEHGEAKSTEDADAKVSVARDRAYEEEHNSRIN